MLAGPMLATALTVLALSTTPITASAAPASLDPDPFYSQTEATTGPVGTPISVRRAPDLFIFPGSAVWQVNFRSLNSANNPIVAVTTVIIPPNHTPDGPLLSYQHIVNALGTECAPSRALYSSDPRSTYREAVALNIALQRGWAVALPDHLGPTSAYGAARLGGQITLDGIRAVQKLPELGLTSSPVGIAGYSGGGMATAWAAALAPTYAPEINIVGVAEGGVPMNITKMANALGRDPHPAFGLAFAAALGLEREYPTELPLTSQLNGLGHALATDLTNACTTQLLITGAGRSALDVALSTSMLDNPDAISVMNDNSVELYPGVPTAPIYEWHSATDNLIPVDSVVATMARYCAAGATIQSVLGPNLDHLTVGAIGLPAAVDYLQDRFAGRPAPSNC
ncbi:lipase [Rhodococcus sp. ACPA4]|uniref:lipase family protein n=1 Tax=Rhodococcus sp. ACPA4 TaxID=2028571 RepID=UPI000BB13B72|nr:lipase family protein [Rhodococcus sp. ACPA4]PBC41132.1 lipase [Rhodococcus sp. ACPA4]